MGLDMSTTKGVLDYLSTNIESFVDSIPSKTQVLPRNSFSRGDNNKLQYLFIHIARRSLNDFFGDYYQDAFSDVRPGFVGGAIDDREGFRTCIRIYSPSLLERSYS